MSDAYCFVEKCPKPRIVITFDRDIEQLPKSKSGWDLRETINTDTVTPDMGIVGVGNAEDILQSVRRSGPFVAGGTC